MPQNITATSANTTGSAETMRSPRRRELVKLQGEATAVGDTSNVYTCQFLDAPAVVEGGSIAAIFSGRTVTFTSLVALDSNAVWVWVAEAI